MRNGPCVAEGGFLPGVAWFLRGLVSTVGTSFVPLRWRFAAAARPGVFAASSGGKRLPARWLVDFGPVLRSGRCVAGGGFLPFVRDEFRSATMGRETPTLDRLSTIVTSAENALVCQRAEGAFADVIHSPNRDARKPSRVRSKT